MRISDRRKETTSEQSLPVQKFNIDCELPSLWALQAFKN